MHRGFTLIEACVVLAVLGILAALGVGALTSVRQRDAISVAPRQLAAALENAKTEALATGREVVLVLVGNDGVADAAKCRSTSLDRTPCVRLWVLEDRVGGGSTRFDPSALAAFDPAAPEALGDRLLATEVLPDGIYLGRHPGYVPPAISTDSAVHAGLPLDRDCSFCTTGSPPRGFVRFRPDGVVQLGDPPDPGELATGGTVFFNVVEGGAALPLTRFVTILQPSGLVTDRLGRTVH